MLPDSGSGGLWLPKVSATVTINAAPAEVWAVLCDLDRYPEWYPYILKATGEIQPGGQVAFTEAAYRGGAGIFRYSVTAARPGTELRLRPLRSVVSIERRFTLSPIDSGGQTKVVYSNIFRGLMVPMYWVGLGWLPRPSDPTRILLRNTAQALKQHAEHDPGTT